MNSVNEARNLLQSGLGVGLVFLAIGIAKTSAAQEPADKHSDESVDEQTWQNGALSEEQTETEEGDPKPSSPDETEQESPATVEVPATKDKTAETETKPKAMESARIEVTPRKPWGIELGLGPLVTWVPDDRFDLFSDSSSWPAFAARVGGSVWSEGPFDVAATVGYHFAATSGEVRQTPTELSLHRFLIGGQVRDRLVPWLAPYGRALAGLSYFISELGSGDGEEVPKLSKYAFSAVASAGLQARIIEATRSGLLVHLYVEGGGIFTTNKRLVYRSGSGGPPRAQPIDVGTLSLSGPYLETGALARF